MTEFEAYSDFLATIYEGATESNIDRLNRLADSSIAPIRFVNQPDEYEAGTMDDLIEYMTGFPGDTIPAVSNFNWTL